MSYGTFGPDLNTQFRNHACDLAKRSGSQVEDVLPFVDGSGFGNWNYMNMYIQNHTFIDHIISYLAHFSFIVLLLVFGVGTRT